MKLLIALFTALVVSMAGAQTVQTTPNLITSGTTHTWSGVTTGSLPANYMPGGPSPIYDPSTNTISFSYNSNAYVGQVMWVNQALANAGSGVRINGYNYSYDIRNMNGDDRQGGVDTLTVAQVLRGANNSTLLSSNQYYNTKFDWKTITGTKTATTPYNIADVTYFQIGITGGDNGYWGGYFGPQVRNVNMSLNYTVNPCAANPLSSTSCAGYAQAYHDQQCTANPLYATSCPGYTAAYQTQQCTANPLYSPECPGYQQAYFNQQCTANPLYATTCPGYQQAYFNQQCTANPLYATTCSGYDAAYKAQQCNLNGLYDRTCPNYAEAYAKKNIVNDATKIEATTTVTPTTSSSTTESASNPATTAISDPVVKSAVTTSDTTSAVSPTSMTSTVSVINPPKTQEVDTAIKTVSVDVPVTQAQQQERQQDQKKTDGAVASVERRAGGNAANVRAAATERAKELAKEAGGAKTMEAQAATQGLVVGLMGYVPGFSAYQNAIVPDVLGAQVARQYHKPTVDNRSAQRQLSGSNEYRWKEMVDSQYRGN